MEAIKEQLATKIWSIKIFMEISGIIIMIGKTKKKIIK
jgi:hypothetical protein